MNIVRCDSGWLNLDNGFVFYERPEGGFTAWSLQSDDSDGDNYVLVTGENAKALRTILRAATIHTKNQYSKGDSDGIPGS